MSNEQVLIHLWALAGHAIDEQRLRIFRMIDDNQQREILVSIERKTITSNRIKREKT